MNIWEWVRELKYDLRDAGQHRLLTLLDTIPTLVVDNEHARAEALFPEALAMVRELDLPWAEVFVRHWALQSRVRSRSEVKHNLSEAVDLLDFSHQEKTRGCPQSVCAVQDLAQCYARTDGPGYAQERLDVSNETLLRIDPTWDCYQCIATEYADALLDLGRTEEALKFTRAARAKLARETDLPLLEALALLALAKPSDALGVVDSAPVHSLGGDNYTERRALIRARCLVALGRYDEASASMPAIDTVLPTPTHYAPWIKVAEPLVTSSQWPNDDAVNQLIGEMADRLEHNGGVRDALELRAAQARLALLRKRPFIAGLASNRIAHLITSLAQPLDAPAKLAQLEAQIDSLKSRTQEALGQYPSPRALLDAVAANELDDDGVFELRLSAHAWWDDDPDILAELCEALHARGWHAECLTLARDARGKHPESAQFALLWGYSAMNGDAEGELYEAATEGIASNSELTPTWHWLLAQLYSHQGEADNAIAALDTLLASETEAWNARKMRAGLYRRQGVLAMALTDLDVITAAGQADTTVHWERIGVATRLGRWRQCRESALANGIELTKPEQPGDPIDERWEDCLIAYEGPDGQQLTVLAERTGPVTARLEQIPQPKHPRRLGDVVIFDPAPNNAPPDEDATEEERNAHLFEYAYVDLLEAGIWQGYELDGVHPGETVLDSLRAELEARHCILSVRSDERYTLEVDGDDILGIYAYIAVPETVSARDISICLADILGACHAPLVWTTLAIDGADSTRAVEHAGLAKAFQLDA
jgi:hypothetical protein